MDYSTVNATGERWLLVRSVTWVRPLAIAMTVVLCLLVARGTLATGFGFDDAYNLTLTRNLGTHFKYATPYFPEKVYDRAVTTNGPMQYIGAAAFAVSHDIDAAAVAGTVSAILLLCIGLLLLRPVLVFVAAALFFIWPTFHYVSISFMGDIFASGCALIGIALLERAPYMASSKRVLSDRVFWLAAIAFAAAVATKFIALFFILPVAFSIVFLQDDAPWLHWKTNALRSIAITAVVAAVTIGLFFGQYAFSVAHTIRTIAGLSSIPVQFFDFLFHHYQQGEGNIESRVGIVEQFTGFTSHVVLLVIALAATMILVRRVALAPIVAVGAAVWLGAGLLERRMLPLFIIVIALGGREVFNWIDEKTAQSRRPALIRLAVGLASCVALITAFTVDRDSRLGRAADPQRQWATAILGGHYSPVMLEHIRQQRYVVTSGWWQVPEMESRWGLRFYDRMNPSNLFLPKSETALLFYPRINAFPNTSEAANCDSVIYRDGPLELCRIRGDVPLDYQAIGETISTEMPKTYVKLRRASWSITDGIQSDSGSAMFAFTGTGAPATQTISTTVPVAPGSTYVFSAFANTNTLAPGSKIDLKIDAADERSTYTSIFIGAQPALRFSTPAWKCPRNVSRVNLVLQFVNAVVQKDMKLVFSDPTLTAYRETIQN